MNDERIVAPGPAEEDLGESSLRPLSLDEFVGQRQLRDNLRVFIEAAKGRGETLDHVLFFGPPGLGKTTLAQIVARELGVGFRATSGPVIQRAGDLAALLTNHQPGDLLFIDEIHRLNPVVEEVLYPAMEDRALDLIIGEGLDAMDRRYLRCIAENKAGGPVGVETVAAALADQRDVVEEVIEPYLIQQGFVQRTPRGRMLTDHAYAYLGLKALRPTAAQLELLAAREEEAGTEEER
jgi:Holliday junction resolvasome RuvABC ATP-dependent DNA helicase subunit